MKKKTTWTEKFVRFPNGNELVFWQDFRFKRGLPDDVSFYPVEETQNGMMKFVGDGYGILPEHNLPGRYGNGAIYLLKADLPEGMLEWCRENFLNK